MRIQESVTEGVPPLSLPYTEVTPHSPTTNTERMK